MHVSVCDPHVTSFCQVTGFTWELVALLPSPEGLSEAGRQGQSGHRANCQPCMLSPHSAQAACASPALPYLFSAEDPRFLPGTPGSGC